MVKIDKKNIQGLVNTLKGIAPANYPSMDRLVTSVQFLEALLETPDDEPEVEVKDG